MSADHALVGGESLLPVGGLASGAFLRFALALPPGVSAASADEVTGGFRYGGFPVLVGDHLEPAVAERA